MNCYVAIGHNGQIVAWIGADNPADAARKFRLARIKFMAVMSSAEYARM